MVIKLKNMCKKWYMKAAAYFMLVVCVVGGSITICSNKDAINVDSIWRESYGESSEFYSILGNFMSAVYMATRYESVEEITPELFEEDTMERLRMEPYAVWFDSNGMVEIDIQSYNGAFFDFGYFYEETDNTMIDNVQSETTMIDNVQSETTPEEERKDLSFEAFLKEFPDLKEGVQKEYADEETRNYLSSMQKLEDEKNLIYEMVDETEREERLAVYENLPIAGYFGDTGRWQKGSSFFENYYYEDMEREDQVIFVGVKQEFYDQQVKEWKKEVFITKQVIQEVCVYAAVALFMLLYLLIITGYEPNEKKVRLYIFDRVWSEVQWAVGIFSGIGFIFCYVLYFEGDGNPWLFKLIMVGAIACATLTLVCILSQLRRLKARKFLNGFLCLRVCTGIMKKMYQVIKIFWQRGKLSKRALLLAVLLPVLCVTWVGAPFVVAFLIYMIYKYIGDFNEIVEGTKIIKEGGLTHKIVVKEDGGILGELAENINTLSQGLEAAVSNELRSERMKAELISNVSHDLKTPLTSIITYVDLLKQEHLENENARNYIDVIDRKAQRLTVLTSDLFEAAKASSGAMPVTLEKIDLNAIVRQALGEFDEKIQKANLEIRTKLPENSSYISADGKLTWRVLDNLLSNVIKYGLTGSRVYLEVEEENQVIQFTMKNISAYELNIPSQELMERFKRGDESRNSEGSGLGLSIANSLVILQHGSFAIDIDGDLFKVTMHLPKYTKKE